MTTNAIQIYGRKIKQDYSKKYLDAIWEKVRPGDDWKKRFGADADSVMKELRRRR